MDLLIYSLRGKKTNKNKLRKHVNDNICPSIGCYGAVVYAGADLLARQSQTVFNVRCKITFLTSLTASLIFVIKIFRVI